MNQQVAAVGGVGQIDVLSSLLQQAQHLQVLKKQLAAVTATEPEPQPVFNTVGYLCFNVL